MADAMNLNLVTSLSMYKISGHPDKTATKARQAITVLINDKTLAINGTVINATNAQNALGDKSPVPVKLNFINRGTCLVYGNADSSEGSHPITAHRTICFDMSTGNSVTGVNPNWLPDEFKPIGVALASLSNGRKLIPVNLALITPPGSLPDIMFRLITPLPSAPTVFNAVRLEINQTTNQLEDQEEMIVLDSLYQGLAGGVDDVGFAQKFGNGYMIKTLTCKAPIPAS